MGIIKKGIMGGFSGKVGPVVGASWRGIDYIRAMPRKSEKPSSSKQLMQQGKMKLLRGFLLGVAEIIEDCFQNFEQKTPMNAALSYNLYHTTEGATPEEMVISFPNLIYSKGDLLACWSLKVVCTASLTIDFSWENSAFNPMCAGTDRAIVVVYDPVSKQFFRAVDAGVRQESSVKVIVPEDFKGHAVHCYISFYSEEKSIASTNQYLGSLDVL
ncbi:DUF6266 family protein [Pedobacter frigoris]|uniref:Uncharacterized protein n=1 Tax=Pedobacter frigoris TaxID=2571272 RepID=A0A4U1CCD1_9SPHI|nr:DUF6266 family protein [Pedobacter frigoris]TKC03715.1 hypothetical protein FA047_19325 [Pedobacter frigoris]